MLIVPATVGTHSIYILLGPPKCGEVSASFPRTCRRMQVAGVRFWSIPGLE